MKNRTLAASAAAILATTALVAAQPGHRPGPPPPPPPSPDQPHPPHDDALVTAVDAERIGLARPEGWVKSVSYDGATRFHRGPEPLAASDLRVGLRVHEHDRPGMSVAEDVDVLPGAHLDGTLLRSDGERFALRDRSGLEEQVELAPGARVHSRRWPMRLSAAHSGDHVVVNGDPTDGGVLANDVDFPDASHSEAWLLLPAGLAVGGWYRFYGRRKTRRSPGPDLIYPARD